MVLLCYPSCSTCKKAERFLNGKNINYTYRDIKLSNPSYDELRKWLTKSGTDIGKFFNASGLKYRQLNLKDELKSMTAEQKLRLLATDGMLVKRPVLVTEKSVLTGFNEKKWQSALIEYEQN